MRVAQVLLATSVVLVACSSGISVAADGGIKVKTSTTATTGPDSLAATVLADEGNDNNDIFAYKMPFKYNNTTGTMVITIDKSSLKKVSGDTPPSDLSQIYDFSKLEENAQGSGDEERGLFSFAATHFAQYKLTQKAVSWLKGVF